MPRGSGRRPDPKPSDRRLRTVPTSQSKPSLRRAEGREDSLVGKLEPLLAEHVKPPEGMPDGRVKNFDHAVQWVIDAEVATVGDMMLVTEMARVWADLQQVCFLLEQDGLTVSREDRMGNVIITAHPLLPERGRLRTAFKTLLAELGMTPNARRLMVQNNPEKEVDEEDAAWAALLQPAS